MAAYERSKCLIAAPLLPSVSFACSAVFVFSSSAQICYAEKPITEFFYPPASNTDSSCIIAADKSSIDTDTPQTTTDDSSLHCTPLYGIPHNIIYQVLS